LIKYTQFQRSLKLSTIFMQKKSRGASLGKGNVAPQTECSTRLWFEKVDKQPYTPQDYCVQQPWRCKSLCIYRTCPRFVLPFGAHRSLVRFLEEFCSPLRTKDYSSSLAFAFMTAITKNKELSIGLPVNLERANKGEFKRQHTAIFPHNY